MHHRKPGAPLEKLAFVFVTRSHRPAFKNTEWRTFFDTIFGWASVPPSGARIDTPRAVAHLVMVMMAKLTFAAPPTPAGVAIYGAHTPTLGATALPQAHHPSSAMPRCPRRVQVAWAARGTRA